MRFNEFKRLIENVNLGPAGAAPGAPATKQKFVITPPTSRRGPEVADVQKALVALGYSLPKHGVDGIRGPETIAAVKKFQTDNGLAVDGDPGPNTVTKLNDILKSKPEVANTLTKSTAADVKGPVSPSAIDTSAIQDPDFNSKVDKIASALGVSSKDLMAIMKFESGINPSKYNMAGSKAVGLIQFMPKTARSLGTSTEELAAMTAVDQLDYVYKYFKMIGVRPGMDLGDLYISVFYPAALGKDNNFVIARETDSGFSGQVYAQNKGLDKNKDGMITVGDAKQAIQQFA